VLNGHGGNVGPLHEAVPGFASKLGINIRTHSLLGCIHTGDREEVHGERQGAGARRRIRNVVCDGRVFPQRIHWEGVDYQKIKPLLHIKDPKSAADEEQFAKEAKLATTGEGRGDDRHCGEVDGESIEGDDPVSRQTTIVCPTLNY